MLYTSLLCYVIYFASKNLVFAALCTTAPCGTPGAAIACHLRFNRRRFRFSRMLPSPNHRCQLFSCPLPPHPPPRTPVSHLTPLVSPQSALSSCACQRASPCPSSSASSSGAHSNPSEPEAENVARMQRERRRGRDGHAERWRDKRHRSSICHYEQNREEESGVVTVDKARSDQFVVSRKEGMRLT